MIIKVQYRGLHKLVVLLLCGFIENNAVPFLSTKSMDHKVNTTWMNYAIMGLQHCTQISDSSKDMLSYVKMLQECTRSRLLEESSVCERQGNELSLFISKVSEFFHFCPVLTSLPSQEITFSLSTSFFEGKQLHQSQTKPMGQQCNIIRYTSNNNFITFINGKMVGDQKSFDKIRYMFHTHILFNLNITFSEFTLSDMCIISHPYKFLYWMGLEQTYCSYHSDTEFVLIHQNESQNKFSKKLYFCMRRPKWTIFTKSFTLLDYYICRICLHHQSTLKFTYQVMGEDAITLKDIYRFLAHGTSIKINAEMKIKAHSSLTPFSITCVYLPDICHTHIYNYDVRGNKYEFIKIWRSGNTQLNALLLNNLNHNEVLAELKHNSVKPIKFFYCTVQLRMENLKYLSSSYIKFSKQEVNAENISAKLVTLTNKNFHCKILCQKVFIVNSHISNYAIIKIINVHFIGFRTYMCLHGGISFYELSDNLTRYFRGRAKYREIYNLCNNYTGQFNTHSLSTLLYHESKYLKAPYTAASHRTLIAIYYQNNDILKFNLKVSRTKCRGVFRNICTKETFPFNYWKKRLHYEYPFHDTSNTCITVQMGSQFLFSNVFYKPFYLKVACSYWINMKENSKWCGAYLIFL